MALPQDIPETEKDYITPMPPSADQPRWEALFRGQILSTTTTKFFNYVALADQKAQGLIFMNSILIPVALNWIDKPNYHLSSVICIFTAVSSILTAMICIYPKRRKGKKPDGTFNLLHFGDIGRMKEPEFMDEFLPVFNNPSQLAEVAAKDIHDTARRIIRPKFFWLKLSYLIFFFGNLAAIACALYMIWYL
ncbi:MAG: Pycsar system effector family protein [Alphaproteobacteria bacterium]